MAGSEQVALHISSFKTYAHIFKVLAFKKNMYSIVGSENGKVTCNINKLCLLSFKLKNLLYSLMHDQII